MTPWNISHVHFHLSDIQVLWTRCHHLCIWTLLSVIRGLAIAVLPWMLNLWSSCQTVFVESGSSRWIFSSAVLSLLLSYHFCCSSPVIFFKQSFSMYGQYLTVNADFCLLFLFTDITFLWFVYAERTLETVTLDIVNSVAVSVIANTNYILQFLRVSIILSTPCM
jgi:hypothetical protein